MEKNRIEHVYCCPDKVKNDFIDQCKSNNWNKKEDLDDIEF